MDDLLCVHEEFIGLYEVESIEASSLFFVVKDVLLRLNLTWEKARGQCYDGASNMSGKQSGLAKRITDEQPKAYFTHCYGHSLNLAACDMIRRSMVMKKALETTQEITKLVKYSPRRENLFKHIKDEIAPTSPGVCILCPTRWTVRANSMQSIIENYAVLQELWEEAASIVHDTETIARIRGVEALMQSFDFFFGLVLGEKLLRITDNLSKTLQIKTFSASEGQEVAKMTKRTLKSMRSEENFNLFWELIMKMSVDVDVSEPRLPRRRKVPARYEEGSAPPEFPSTVKELYRPQYYAALDLIIQAIDDRFDQPGYKTYSSLQNVLLKVLNSGDISEELKVVLDSYGSDFHATNLKPQLEIFAKNVPGDIKNIFDIKNYLQQLGSAEKALLSEVITIMKLILVMPATNAMSERSFSAMWRVKSYLRSTMHQERLNHLMILHIHKDKTDQLFLPEIANDFISKSERRSQAFGKF